MNSVKNESVELIIQEVNSKNELHKFIYLPAKIHKDHPNWVPPIYMDDWDFFNPKKNKSFQSCDFLSLNVDAISSTDL